MVFITNIPNMLYWTFFLDIYIYINIKLTRAFSVANITEKAATIKNYNGGTRLNYWHYIIEGIARFSVYWESRERREPICGVLGMLQQCLCTQK